jgi:hypothetical protein
MLYYAFQILCGNIDWPHNNSYIWRAEGTGELTDGRWRMALKDLDVAFGQMVYSWDDVLAHALRRSAFLPQLLKNEAWKNEFIETCERLLAATLHPDYIMELAAELRFSSASEQVHTGVFTRDPVGRDTAYAQMADFLAKQPAFLASSFERNLGVTLTLPEAPPPPLRPKESYTFAHNSILLNGVMSEQRTRYDNGVLRLEYNGEWMSVNEFAVRHGLSAVVHTPTNSVMFLPAVTGMPR